MAQSRGTDEDESDQKKPRVVALEGQSIVKGPGLKNSESDSEPNSDS